MNVDSQVRKPAIDQYRNKIPDHEVLIVRLRHYYVSVLFGVPSFLIKRTAFLIINASD